MSANSHPADLVKIVVGTGCYARVLATVLAGNLLDLDVQPRQSREDREDAVAGIKAFIVIPPGVSGTWFVRMHRALWDRLSPPYFRWLIIAADGGQADTVRCQDIYGRASGKETAGKWRDRYPVVTRLDSLVAFLRASAQSQPMYRSTWRRHDTAMPIIQEMRRRLDAAISKERRISPQRLLSDLPTLAWECFGSHADAHQIREWLARDNACHATLSDGKRLLERF